MRAQVVDDLIAAGVTHLEATSFVSPRAVPQLADAHEMLTLVTRRKDAHIAALVTRQSMTRHLPLGTQQPTRVRRLCHARRCRHGWHVTPGSDALLFDTPPARRWQAA